MGKIHPLNWWELAACRGEPTDWWFPAKGAHNADNRHALDVCWQRCTVRTDCLADALNNPDGTRFVYGIWGGFTLDQRIRLLPKGHPHDRRPT